MSYIRHDKDCNLVSPQPGSTSVTVFDNCEGWTPITYEDWNDDYVARSSDNTVRTPGTYQARNSDNTVRIPAAYQRHDINNVPVDICPTIGGDDPANAAEPDATAWVLMDGPLYNTPGVPSSGFVGGQSWRKMAPLGYSPYGKETYSYGDEQVRWNGAYWAYVNDTAGRTFATSYDNVQWPWLATWSDDFTGAKITSTYVKTTNYPEVP
jgi:hypothetical protein